MAEPNPGHVCSCVMSWELWLQSEHLLQKYYMGFTQVCGTFGNKELEASKFLLLTHFKMNKCYYFCANDLKPPGILKSTE